MTKGNPWDDPNWKPLKREATLVRQLLGSGVTSLGKASYADGLGNYYNAFFGLSIGIERLAKMVCVCDHAIDNNGAFPSSKTLRKSYGHDIPKLLDTVEKISRSRNLNIRFERPCGDIETAIVERLSSFADAKQGRYNNFDTLDNSSAEIHFEPLRKWWDEVAERVLKAHYYGRPIQHKKESNAQQMNAMIGSISMVIHFNERGDLMNDVYTASLHTGKTEVVQKYSRYYTLKVIRWLADVFDKISHSACYDEGIDAFFGHAEHFDCYRTDDSFLKTRKIWPLK